MRMGTINIVQLSAFQVQAILVFLLIATPSIFGHNINKRRAHGRGYTRGAVESVPNNLATQYSGYQEENTDDTETPFSRSAVESTGPIADFYSSLRQEDNPTEFDRGGVEAFPFQYDTENEFENVILKAFNEEDDSGKAGIRDAVESRPNKEFPFNDEPHFKSGQTPLNYNYDQIFAKRSPYKHANFFSPVAGSDVQTYSGLIRQVNSQYRVVCFYGGWSIYRDAPYNFGAQDIDPHACTHVVYSFAKIDEENLTIAPMDKELDIVKGGYKSTVALRRDNPRLKVIIGLGGYAEGGKKFSRMASTKEGREKFINSCVEFLKENDFDGLLIDWEYPGSSDRGGRYEDKENFALLSEELKEAFRPNGYELTAVLSSDKHRIDQGYDIPRLGRSLDFVCVSTYDLRGDWDGKADHHAPLTRRTTDFKSQENLNVEDGVDYLVSLGAPKEKIIIGIPFYGRSFTLEDPTQINPGSRARTVGKEGRYTREQGFMAYYEVCTEQRNGGWQLQRDEIGGPFMVKGDQWISFDDPDYIYKKTSWVKREGLGGAMVWAIDLDDYLGQCGTRWPLLSAVRRSLLSDFEPVQEPYFSLSTSNVISKRERNLLDNEIIDTEDTASATIDNNFECKGPGYYVVGRDCASYYICNGEGQAFKLSCGTNMFFDIDKRICKPAFSVNCQDGDSKLDRLKEQSCRTNGLYSDPNDCSNYAWCRDGVKTLFRCPYSSYFDPRSGMCTASAKTLCVPGFQLRVENPVSPTLFSPSIKSGDVNSEKKVVCYFTNWARYRSSLGIFVPENVDPSLCTHLIYAFAILDPGELLTRSLDPFTDFDHGFYQRTIALKKQNPSLKVMLALGGWTDSATDKYSRLVNSRSSRARFVEHVVLLLQAYGFDGLDLHWQYPVCWQLNCRTGPSSDKQGFASLIKELRAAFDEYNFLLSAAIAPAQGVIDRAYDIPTMSKYLDFMNVLTLDFHGSWDGKTGHVSPLYFRQGDQINSQNTDFVMNFLLKRGADRSKLIMGIPFYGQTFTLANNYQYGLNAPTVGPGEPGPITGQKGMLAYYEICYNARSGWSKASDPSGAIGPYANGGNQWVGYDDPSSVARKAEYIKQNNFGGAMIWSIDFDDFQNRCCREPQPLLRAINRVLRTVSYPQPTLGGSCSKPPAIATPPPPVKTTTYSSSDKLTRPPTPGLEFFNSTTTLPPWMTTYRPRPTTNRPSTTPWWVPSTTRSTTTTPTTNRPSTTSWWVPSTTRRTTTTPTTTTTERITTTRRPWWQTTTREPPTTTRRPAPSIPQTGIGRKPGDSCQFNEYVPLIGQCDKFLRCNQGKLMIAQCTPGLHWNNQRKQCDWPKNAGCIIGEDDDSVISTTQKTKPNTNYPITISTTTPSTTTKWWRPPSQTTPTTQTFPNESNKCFNDGKTTSHPNDCSKFRQCLAGSWIELQCPPGLHWNTDKDICDWPRLAKCNIATREPSADNQLVTAVKPDVRVPCNEGEYMRDTEDCSSYLLCVYGDYVRYSCKPPLMWNQDKKICDWSHNVQCNNNGVSTSDGDNQGTVGDGYPRPTASPVTQPPPPPAPVPSVELEPAPSSGRLSGDYKVVCYFTNWAWYRPGIGKYRPEDIDPTLCTHIVYGFAVLDYSNLVIKAHDSWADFDNEFYRKVTDFKKMGIKVTIAIGGWNDSKGPKYSNLVNNPTARKRFTEHVLQFILKHNFDGLDLDWEYPVCWQVDCSAGPASDKQGFSDLVKELSMAFKPHGLLLSAAVSPSKKVIDHGYDVQTMSDFMDWIAVMTYDFHGQWDKKTGHVAPMYYHPEDDYDYFNMDFAIRYWIEKGAAKDKLVLGMPMYGQSFTLNSPSVHGLNAPAGRGGQAGQYTRASGFLAYYEICDAVRNGWNVVKDPEGRMGPYAYSGNQWVSYDDVDTIRRKSQYIRDMGLAGGMVWALDLDDFTNRCGQGAHPLMNTIKSVLGPPKSGHEGMTGVTSRPQVTSTTRQPDEPVPEVSSVRPPTPTIDENPGVGVGSGTISTTKDDYKIVCYFTNWAWYRNGEGKYKPEDIDPSLCTHIVYGFAVLDNSRLLIKPHDRWADYDNEFYKKVTDLKKQGVKVLIAIGGWNDSLGRKYSDLVNNPAARKRFTDHVIQFILDNNFDGLDLDWEYPVCWQVDCTKGPASDKDGFSAWVKELKMAFEPHGLLLSAAVSPSNKVVSHGYDVPVLSKYLDWIAVMTYDYHGQWDKKTGHVAPMYGHPEDDNPAFNTNFTIHYWIEQGADRKKLVMGLPMYGQSFTLAQSSNNGLNQKTYGGGEAGPYTRARGFLAYYEICYFIQNQKWNVVRDPLNTMGPYAYKGNQWVGFDDIGVIREKTKWIKEMGLGGGMIWALDLDDFRNRCGCERHPLLRTINRVLRGYHIPDPGCAPFVSRASSPKPSTSIIQSTRTPSVYPTTTVRSTSTSGKCEEGEFRKHSSDCNKFYQCIFGVLEERSCFPGLHWNGVDRCDWPSNAKCVESGMTPAPLPPTPTKSPVTVPSATQPTSTVRTTTAPSTTASWQRPTQSTSWQSWTRPTTTPAPTFPAEIGSFPSPESSQYKVVCYFTNWAWYRQGAGKYKPSDIDPSLCTHIVYGFAVLDPSRLLIKPHDTWADYDNYFYKQVTAWKRYGIKVLLAIGGWNDSLGSKYSNLVNNAEARRRFVKHVIEFIQKHNFDGLDLDWEYPKCWQVDCSKGPASDKQAFSAWIRELHEAFQPNNLLLSAAVSPSYKVIEAGYEVPALSRYLDWIAVMTYDYHGHWDKKTGHVAPMYFHPDDETPQFNTNYTIHYWIENGADRRKIVMGMPMYGQSFSLKDQNKNGLNQPASKGQAGEYTRAAGFLAYYEICDRIRNKGYTVVKDPEGRMGPYAYSGRQWVGFDDVEMIRYKSNYIKNMGLGGGMIWALDLDDFTNKCGCEHHPLLKTINRVLRGHPQSDPGCRL